MADGARPCLRYGPNGAAPAGDAQAPLARPARPLYGPWLDAALQLARGPLARPVLRARLGWGAHRLNQTLHLMTKAGLLAQGGPTIALTDKGRRRLDALGQEA